MAKLLAPRPDLGVRQLLPDWKALFSRKHLRDDLVAGVTVAFIAVPLSLAIALASGVPPAVGLVTAIVAGIVCALFGGTPLQVSGPAAAMAVLVADIVAEQGLPALLVVGLACGVLQLLTGALGLGRYIKLVPVSVIEGFTAGIGAIILVQQLPRALGLPPPEDSRVLYTLTHLASLLPQTNIAALGLVVATLGIIYTLPRVSKRIPPHLTAVVTTTAVVAAIGLDVRTIGDIPRSLPAPTFPSFDVGSLGTLAGSVLVVYALASLETLLSASAVDKMAKGQRSDPDQELIGQGFGNMASAMFGGIPVTGVIARSGTNVHAGAKTRRSAIVHAVLLLVTVLAIAPLMERIPVATLAGVLFSIAFRMLDPKILMRYWRHARGDAIVFAVTFLVIVFVDLIEGVRWGVVAALAVAAIQLGRTRTIVHAARAGEHYLYALEGPLTFLSSLGAEGVRQELRLLEPGRAVVFDVRRITMLDASGAELLAGLATDAKNASLRPYVVGLDAASRARLVAAGVLDPDEVIVDDEAQLSERLGDGGLADSRLATGLERYRSNMRPRYSQIFERLSNGQTPHTLFITCSDSRISPSLITATEPGELFIVRDIGNVVPRSGAISGSSVAAAVEYAVGVLGVQKIVVCGHSACGAITAIRAGEKPEHLPNLSIWLERTDAQAFLKTLPRALSIDDVARMNVLEQLDHLRTYPLVAQRLDSGALSLAGWFFDIGHADVEVWSPERGRFVRDAPSAVASAE